MRCSLLSTALLLAGMLTAQVRVDRPVVLDGTDPGQRRVMGLADAAAESDALNARSAMHGLFRHGVATGTADAWIVDLTPALAQAPSAGMELIVRVTSVNTGAVTIDLGAGGIHALVKDASSPLEGGELTPGMMARLLYDGDSFHLTNGRPLTKRPCPTGFVQVNEQFCIEPDQRDTLMFPAAAIACGSIGARLCTWSEFLTACNQATDLGLVNMVGDYEWSNNTANGDMLVRVVGQFSCNSGATAEAVGLQARPFRCCYRR